MVAPGNLERLSGRNDQGSRGRHSSSEPGPQKAGAAIYKSRFEWSEYVTEPHTWQVRSLRGWPERTPARPYAAVRVSIFAISSSLSRRFAAARKPSTCPGFLKPTMAPVTAGWRSVQAMATAPGDAP